ncbi:MAG: carboxypeptidase M32 [Phycisphaeraceae bacterium]|nr:carboxypeptidase M32 [Phycisphaeraceae bacterium]
MSTTTTAPYERLLEILNEEAVLGSIGGLIGWDQETMMPAGGATHRAKQLSLLARLGHERMTSSEVADLLAACESEMDVDADTEAAANVRNIRHDHDRAVRLPASLVQEHAETASAAQHEWAEARNDNDFKRFLPWLEKTVDICRRKAECYGWAEGGEPWDALAEDYEPGCTAAGVAEVFGPLRDRLRDLIAEIVASGAQPDGRLDGIELPRDRQMDFCMDVAERIGFDRERGRLDVSTHPFCGGSHCDDVRMTTRFHDGMLTDAVSSTMHESGHAMYEQGLRYEAFGTPCGSSVSLGIHESQSRMWENQVGRSESFWRFATPMLERHFGAAVAGIDARAAFESANRVAPGFIRVEADEATYNMHVMIRFELERAMLTGDLEPAGVPEAWNAAYRDYLGLEVPDDRRGCLQDVHWSMGALGYFPTYTLGNLYCAQIFEHACEVMPGLVDGFADGEFSGLLDWLRSNIHVHGRRYSPAQLCERITGRPLSADPLMRYLEGKFRPLYGI